MTRESHPNPPRLAERDDAVGRLLGRGADEFAMDVDEGTAFHRLERTRRRRARVAWAAAASVLLGALFLVSTRTRTPLLDERFAAVAEADDAALSSTRAALPAPARADEPSHLEPAPPRVVEPSPEPRTPLPLSNLTTPLEPVAPTEARCRELAGKGNPGRAVECFRSVSRGTGLEAEVALYQAARLSAEQLEDQRRALELLTEYERRYPEGALRGEAGWLRVRSLRATGRFEEALQASERLLATPAGRTLARDIHFLRGVIYQDEQHDCAGAAIEFVALVGEPGARGDEAELRRARCLEELGRRDDAREAYEKYLKRPDPRGAAEARARLARFAQ
ncbi:MAG TPA: tetratricopeptide repeat protein [Polyangiaceae bacterium]